ncbi:hypothetical protein K440DRAFT_685975, partial [Wilcoxina mikolae CBS 423.85]
LSFSNFPALSLGGAKSPTSPIKFSTTVISPSSMSGQLFIPSQHFGALATAMSGASSLIPSLAKFVIQKKTSMESFLNCFLRVAFLPPKARIFKAIKALMFGAMTRAPVYGHTLKSKFAKPYSAVAVLTFPSTFTAGEPLFRHHFALRFPVVDLSIEISTKFSLSFSISFIIVLMS